MIHLTSNPVSSLQYGSLWHIIIFSINKILTFSVPIFIFLSGFKLYGKYKDTKIDIKRFYIGRFKKIVIPYIICVLIFFLYFFTKGWVLLKDLPQYLFLGTLAAHFYYIVIAVQLYILFPGIKAIFEKISKISTAASLIITVCCLEFSGFAYSDRFMGTYIFYFVFGMLFSQYKLYEKVQKLKQVFIPLYIVTAIVHVTLSYKATGGELFYRFGHLVNMVYVMLSLLTLYCIFSALKSNAFVCKICGAISGVSFSVYLYHILVIFILQYDVYTRFSLSIREMFVISFTVLYSIIFAYSFLNHTIKKIKS